MVALVQVVTIKDKELSKWHGILATWHVSTLEVFLRSSQRKNLRCINRIYRKYRVNKFSRSKIPKGWCIGVLAPITYAKHAQNMQGRNSSNQGRRSACRIQMRPPCPETMETRKVTLLMIWSNTDDEGFRERWRVLISRLDTGTQPFRNR